MEKSLRYRVNVGISTKGVVTWDCTVDGENQEMFKVLQESDALVAELEKRYPITLEVKDGTTARTNQNRSGGKARGASSIRG